MSTKAAQSHDQTCEVTCLACDMQDDSDAMLPVINFKDGLQAGEEGRPGEEEEKNEGSGVAEDDSFSSSDTLSPSFLTSKFTGFIPHPPPHPQTHSKGDLKKMASTFIVPQRNASTLWEIRDDVCAYFSN